MRIALDCRCVFQGMGGIGRYAWSLLREFAVLDRTNEYIGYFTRLALPGPLDLPFNFTTRSLECGMIDERFDQLILPTLLEEDAIDLYHNPTFSVPLVKTRARTVSTIHDVVFRRRPDLVEPRLGAFLHQSTLRSAKIADRLITVSRYSAREISDLYAVDASRIEIIPNGVHTPSSRPCADLARFGIEPRRYVLYVGSIEEKKNIAYLLRGFHGWSRAGMSLVLAGSRADKNDPLERTIAELGLQNRVRILGYVDDPTLEALYAEAFVFVYPSLYEGFGLPPLEAMRRRVPTIVSDATSLPEVVGEGALLVDPSRPQDLAAALVRLEDPSFRVTLIEKGENQARTFRWTESARRHLKLYEEVLNRHEDPARCL